MSVIKICKTLRVLHTFDGRVNLPALAFTT